MSIVIHVDEEIMCMEDFGAQNEMELRCLLERCVLAYITKPKHEKTVDSSSGLNESSQGVITASTDTDTPQS